jgi:hypothetical protein
MRIYNGESVKFQDVELYRWQEKGKGTKHLKWCHHEEKPRNIVNWDYHSENGEQNKNLI